METACCFGLVYVLVPPLDHAGAVLSDLRGMLPNRVDKIPKAFWRSGYGFLVSCDDIRNGASHRTVVIAHIGVYVVPVRKVCT